MNKNELKADVQQLVFDFDKQISEIINKLDIANDDIGDCRYAIKVKRALKRLKRNLRIQDDKINT